MAQPLYVYTLKSEHGLRAVVYPVDRQESSWRAMVNKVVVSEFPSPADAMMGAWSSEEMKEWDGDFLLSDWARFEMETNKYPGYE